MNNIINKIDPNLKKKKKGYININFNFNETKNGMEKISYTKKNEISDKIVHNQDLSDNIHYINNYLTSIFDSGKREESWGNLFYGNNIIKEEKEMEDDKNDTLLLRGPTKNYNLNTELKLDDTYEFEISEHENEKKKFDSINNTLNTKHSINLDNVENIENMNNMGNSQNDEFLYNEFIFNGNPNIELKKANTTAVNNLNKEEFLKKGNKYHDFHSFNNNNFVDGWWFRRNQEIDKIPKNEYLEHSIKETYEKTDDLLFNENYIKIQGNYSNHTIDNIVEENENDNMLFLLNEKNNMQEIVDSSNKCKNMIHMKSENISKNDPIVYNNFPIYNNNILDNSSHMNISNGKNLNESQKIDMKNEDIKLIQLMNKMLQENEKSDTNFKSDFNYPNNSKLHSDNKKELDNQNGKLYQNNCNLNNNNNNNIDMHHNMVEYNNVGIYNTNVNIDKRNGDILKYSNTDNVWEENIKILDSISREYSKSVIHCPSNNTDIKQIYKNEDNGTNILLETLKNNIKLLLENEKDDNVLSAHIIRILDDYNKKKGAYIDNNNSKDYKNNDSLNINSRNLSKDYISNVNSNMMKENITNIHHDIEINDNYEENSMNKKGNDNNILCRGKMYESVMFYNNSDKTNMHNNNNNNNSNNSNHLKGSLLDAYVIDDNVLLKNRILGNQKNMEYFPKCVEECMDMEKVKKLKLAALWKSTSGGGNNETVFNTNNSHIGNSNNNSNNNNNNNGNVVILGQEIKHEPTMDMYTIGKPFYDIDKRAHLKEEYIKLLGNENVYETKNNYHSNVTELIENVPKVRNAKGYNDLFMKIQNINELNLETYYKNEENRYTDRKKLECMNENNSEEFVKIKKGNSSPYDEAFSFLCGYMGKNINDYKKYDNDFNNMDIYNNNNNNRNNNSNNCSNNCSNNWSNNWNNNCSNKYSNNNSNNSNNNSYYYHHLNDTIKNDEKKEVMFDENINKNESWGFDKDGSYKYLKNNKFESEKYNGYIIKREEEDSCLKSKSLCFNKYKREHGNYHKGSDIFLYKNESGLGKRIDQHNNNNNNSSSNTTFNFSSRKKDTPFLSFHKGGKDVDDKDNIYNVSNMNMYKNNTFFVKSRYSNNYENTKVVERVKEEICKGSEKNGHNKNDMDSHLKYKNMISNLKMKKKQSTDIIKELSSEEVKSLLTVEDENSLEILLESLYEDRILPLLFNIKGRADEYEYREILRNNIKTAYSLYPEKYIIKRNESGDDYIIYFTNKKVSDDYFMSINNLKDIYSSNLWKQFEEYLEEISKSEDATLYTFSGGRYGMAKELKKRNLPFFEGLFLGQLCHIVHISTNKKIIAYENNYLKPISQCHKYTSAKKGIINGSEKNVENYIMTISELRHYMNKLLKYYKGGFNISTLKKKLKNRFNKQICESVFHCIKLIEVLQLEELKDVCVVDMETKIVKSVTDSM